MPIDIGLIVFVLYMLLVLGIGVYAAQFLEKNPSDFYLAGRGIGTIVLLFTLMATIVSSFAFFGIGATSSFTGLGTFIFIGLEVTLFALVFATLGVTINRVGRRFKLITPTEFLEDRFENAIPSVVYLLISFIALTAFVTAQITGGGIALEILFDVPYTVGAVAIAVFMAIYIHISGMRGVIWSDLVQGVVIVASLVGLMIFMMITIGPNQLVAGVQAESPGLFTYAGPIGLWQPEFILSFTIFFVIGVSAYPQVYQRFLAAESQQVLRKSSLLFPLVTVPLFFAAVALGVWSVGIVPEPANPDYVIPLLIQELTGPIITGIVLAAAVAALMSTTDSVVLTLGSMASRDIYRRHINPDISDRQEVRFGQAVLLLTIFVSLIISLPEIRPAGIFALAEFAVAGFAATAPALFLSLYWAKSTNAGAVSSMIISATIMAGFFLEYIPMQYTFGLHYGFVGLIVSTALFIVVSWMTTMPSSGTIDRYMKV